MNSKWQRRQQQRTTTPNKNEMMLYNLLLICLFIVSTLVLSSAVAVAVGYYAYYYFDILIHRQIYQRYKIYPLLFSFIIQLNARIMTEIEGFSWRQKKLGCILALSLSLFLSEWWEGVRCLLNLHSNNFYTHTCMDECMSCVAWKKAIHTNK